MQIDLDNLPNDTESLKKLLCDAQKKFQKINTEITEEKHQLQQRIENLEHELRLYKIKRYQSQSEKHKDGDPMPLDLFPEELKKILIELNIEPEAETIDITAPASEPAARKPRKSRILSADLPRQDIIHDLPEADKICAHCGDTLAYIGDEPVLEQLAIIPAKQYVIRHIRKKYACGCQQCIKRAPMPTQPIPKSQASSQLLAFLMVSKFLDGLPLYRLEKITARYGLAVTRQNMARWLIQSSEWLSRLTAAFADKILEYDILAADETRLQVLHEPGRDPTSKSWLWIRRGGPPDQVVILIDYNTSRGGEVPSALLKNFCNGYLIADAYVGYRAVAKENKLIIVGCHDHARRKFKEAFDGLPFKARQQSGIAKLALTRYKMLYAIERDLKGESADVIKAVRQQKSLPLLQNFKTWLQAVQQQGVANEKTRTAITYFLNQFDNLTHYCEDGRLPISNILSEHVAKAIAIARKNFLFANSQAGAVASAKIYSVLLTAAAHNLDPMQYLAVVLAHLPNLKHQSIDHLLPWQLSSEQLKTLFEALPSI
jgi:transposase